MKQSKKQTSKKSKIEAVVIAESVAAEAIMRRDFVYSILTVSVLLNLAFFIGWLALQVTTKYDAQVVGLLFGV